MTIKLRSSRTYHDAIGQLNQLQTGARKVQTATAVLSPREKALGWVRFLNLDVRLLNWRLELYTHKQDRYKSCPSFMLRVPRGKVRRACTRKTSSRRTTDPKEAITTRLSAVSYRLIFQAYENASELTASPSRKHASPPTSGPCGIR
jgi:hypothetical protein